MGFASQLIAWQHQHGRHDLPWQKNTDPYKVWLSEIMLQQTQVTTVIPYYRKFVAQFPSLNVLAHASLDDVLKHWSGLGYYARARNLHHAASLIVNRYRGEFPRHYEEVVKLPGVGESTAAAICVFAFDQRHAILDGNVKRVLTRYFGIFGYPGSKQVETLLWKKSKRLVPARDVRVYTQALMDLGATVCTRTNPDCSNCPLGRDCIARCRDQVTVLPTTRPKKKLPLKQTTMWLLLHQGEVLLEKRAVSGLWGGLWSLPETQDTDDACAHCRRQYGIEIGDIFSLPEYVHGFTHFRLHIFPKVAYVNSRTTSVEQGGMVWLSIEDAVGAAVPAPVRKILTQLKTL